MFSVVSVLIASFAFWSLLAGLHRFVWERNLPLAEPREEPTIWLNAGDASRAALRYAAATAELNGLDAIEKRLLTLSNPDRPGHP